MLGVDLKYSCELARGVLFCRIIDSDIGIVDERLHGTLQSFYLRWVGKGDAVGDLLHYIE